MAFSLALKVPVIRRDTLVIEAHLFAIRKERTADGLVASRLRKYAAVRSYSFQMGTLHTYHHLLMALGEPRSSAMEAYRSGTRPKTSVRLPGLRVAVGTEERGPELAFLRAVMTTGAWSQNSYLGQSGDCRRRARTEGRVAAGGHRRFTSFGRGGLRLGEVASRDALDRLRRARIAEKLEALEASLGLVIARVSSVEWNKCSPIVASSEAVASAR